MAIQVVDVGGYVPDNFLLLGSYVGCICRSGLFSSKVAINERLTFGAHVCNCSSASYNLLYRTCSLDEYLALRSCRKTPNSNVCIRIKSLAANENPCQALTDVIKEKYCVNGSYQYFKFFYGQKLYQSLCHFLSSSPSPLDFGKQHNFSIFGGPHVSIPSANDTIAIYKISVMDSVQSCDDLEYVLNEQPNSSHTNIRRLMAGETALIDNRNLICVSCSESYSFNISVTYYKDYSIVPRYLFNLRCRGIERFSTIDFSTIIQDAKFLTYVQVWMAFYPMQLSVGHFAFRLISADFPVSLELNKDGCRKSLTSLLVCSVTLPREANHYAVVESITWSHNGKMVENDSESIVFREPTLKWQIQRQQKKAGDGNVKHILINLIFISVALILIGACLLVIRYKKNRLRRFERSTSLTISPAIFDKKLAQKKAPKAH